jgi:D-3-phosphoglycerate dehydrogenase
MWDSWDPALARLEEAGLRVDDKRSTEAVSLASVAEGAGTRALVVGLEALPGSVIAAVPGLVVVAKPGAGVDNIDLQAATDHGVMVCNTVGSNADAVADHTFALMLAVLRQIPALDARVRRGEGWSPWPPIVGAELWGKTLGVVGTGSIGKAVVRRAPGFAMRVLAHDPVHDPDLASGAAVSYVDLDELLARSDLVTLHLPLLPETRGLIGRDAFARMRPGSYFFNLSRGPLVDEEALAEALRSGHLAGAASDVFENEPPPLDGPLLQAPNLILTPHVAGFSHEAVRASRLQVADVVLRALRGETPDTLVNHDVLSRLGRGP